MNSNKIFYGVLFIALSLALLIPFGGILKAHAQLAGSVTGEEGKSTTKVIQVQASQLSIVFTAKHKTGTTNGFGNADAVIAVTGTPSGTQTVVDTPGLGTGVAAGKQYSSASLASDIAVNPALFKFVNITIPAVQNLTSTITWSAN